MKAVTWDFAALETLLELGRRDRAQALRILRAIKQYAETGRGDIKKLAGSEEWRLRVGEWRVIYGRDKARELIHILGIRLRRDAYD